VRLIVKKDGNKAADRGQPVFAERRDTPGGIDGKEPQRAEFAGAEAEFCHFVENTGLTHLVSPTGDFTHAPRDGRSGDFGVHGESMSFREGFDESDFGYIPIR